MRPRFGHPRPRSPSHGGEGGHAAKGEGGSANERKGREAAARIRWGLECAAFRVRDLRERERVWKLGHKLRCNNKMDKFQFFSFF